MKTQHTPVPWEIDGAYIVKRSELKGADDTVIARVDFTVPGFRKGDKEMIVRAVNSFEDILGELKIAHERDCVSRGICDETCGVREAIARAEGRP